jgi:hypothetical protein
MGKKDKEKDIELVQIEKEKEDMQILFNDLDENIKNKILLHLEEEYKEKLDNFKGDYHKYMVSGRYVTGTNMREIKRGDLAVFLNLETDVTVMERVRKTDGVTIITKNYEYDIALTKTIVIKRIPIIHGLSTKIIIHLCIANVSSLKIATQLKALSDSVFLRNLLKYKDRTLKDKPILQMIIAGGIFGVVLYFSLIQVFKEAILSFIGTLTLNPPVT